ncbi:inositol polyphosphate multikinase-like isoform X1 [Anopheles albimanus]|nr:inositol polyphosphate multikinase-like isoform X1 [Anopheles albimanus]
MARNGFDELPSGVTLCETQVAGHTAAQGCLGLLKSSNDGTVLKPTGKLHCGMREIAFYEQLKPLQAVQLSTERCTEPITTGSLQQLSSLVPRYYGHPKLPIGGKEMEFIQLEDLTEGYEQPCIMDVKIGRRTWDPMATPEKRKAEESKYKACRQTFGLCIPGFQVYSVHDCEDRLIRHGKDYGKQLTEFNIRDAFQLFLNATPDGRVNQELVHSLLHDVRQIQGWSHCQTTFRLYSSSVLLLYDAAHLKTVTSMKQSKSLTRNDHHGDGPLPVEPSSRRPWAAAKMIDFAHAFTKEMDDAGTTRDDNYIQGVDSLVAILNQFLEIDTV